VIAHSCGLSAAFFVVRIAVGLRSYRCLDGTLAALVISHPRFPWQGTSDEAHSFSKFRK
jgi:hypothetical protein